MSAFYIMRAYHITESPRKISLTKLIKEYADEDVTVLIATRTYGFDKKAECFVVGCGSDDDYGVKQGDDTTYTIDTGNGYRNRDEPLRIDHVLRITNGVVVSMNGKPVEPGEFEIPRENRHAYVMK